MTDEPVPPSRRRVLGLLFSTGLAGIFAAAGGRRGLGGPLDQGIGGTGAAPPPDETDRGIGGTGVIGTIRKFGSIYVNDLRIAYPPDAEVLIDGRPATLRDLKLGQVVRVDARGQDDALSTQRISITHEVVGPVESRGEHEIVVLGQTVSTDDLAPRAYRVGEIVAVSGLRRNDGTIVASLIEPHPGSASRVAGPVTRVPGGGLRVGALALDGVSPALIGHRATLEGHVRGGIFIVTRDTSDAMPFPPSVRRLSIESFIERRDGALALGSGFMVAGGGALDIAAGQSVRAVLTTSVGRDGRLTLDSLRTGGRTYRASPAGGGHPGGGGGPGGRGPGGGGRGGGGHGGGGHNGGGGGHNGGGHNGGGHNGGHTGGRDDHRGRDGHGQHGGGHGAGHEGRSSGHGPSHGGRGFAGPHGFGGPRSFAGGFHGGGFHGGGFHGGGFHGGGFRGGFGGRGFGGGGRGFGGGGRGFGGGRR